MDVERLGDWMQEMLTKHSANRDFSAAAFTLGVVHFTLDAGKITPISRIERARVIIAALGKWEARAGK